MILLKFSNWILVKRKNVINFSVISFAYGQNIINEMSGYKKDSNNK